MYLLISALEKRLVQLVVATVADLRALRIEIIALGFARVPSFAPQQLALIRPCSTRSIVAVRLKIIVFLLTQ